MRCAYHPNRLASRAIGVCSECLRSDPTRIEHAIDVHGTLRLRHHLTKHVPTHGNIVCAECGNHCRLDDGEIGFCNLRIAQEGTIKEQFKMATILAHYYDPLPTNCVADWVCPCKTEGLLESNRRFNNLAVFYGSCSSDCLFCQNASYRDMMADGMPLVTPQQLAEAANDQTACICFFGGDPSCNAAYSIAVSELLIPQGIKVCYETNGIISRKWLQRMAEIVIRSGGTLKIDLKAFSPNVYRALTGVSNTVVLNNFRELAKIGMKIDHVFLVASILLVPEYVNITEVRLLCQFIADCDPTIPTALLGFAPHFAMSDLPRTSRAHAFRAKEVAEEMGLENVRIGNISLLSRADYVFD